MAEKLQALAEENKAKEKASKLAGEPKPRAIYLSNVAFSADTNPKHALSQGFHALLTLISSSVLENWEYQNRIIATVFFEGWTEEYVVFVDHSEGGGKILPKLDKVSDQFLTESIRELAEHLQNKLISIDDTDLLTRHLLNEIMRRHG